MRECVILGGAQWAGKTTVAQLLATRHGLVVYAYDYHDARAHTERALANPERYPVMAATRRGGGDPEAWVRRTPAELADEARAVFAERFEMVLDDLARLPAGALVLAEGWGLRPELVAPHLRSPRQAIFLVPSPAFVERQVRELPRAGRLGAQVSDPEAGQRNRLERDRLLADELVASARRLGLTVLVVDGSEDVPAVARRVERHLAPHLPGWLYPPEPGR